MHTDDAIGSTGPAGPAAPAAPAGPGPATDAWREQLEAWRLPDELLEAAPEDPYAFDASHLGREQIDVRSTPTGRRTLRFLGGRPSTLLDVGCGPGGITTAFTDDATVVGVEPQHHLAEAARARGIEVVEATWPDAADRVEPADVVLCTHVLYNVADIGRFVAALDGHARLGVVLELTATHPWTVLGPLYRHFHDLARPGGPSAELAAEAIEEAVGRQVMVEAWQRPAARHPDLETLVAHRRRQLCLPADRDPEIADFVASDDRVQVHDDGTVSTGTVDLATLWWPASA